MPSDDRQKQTARELFLSSFFGGAAMDIESWVIARLVQTMTEELHTPGSILYREGDPAEHHYFVLSGRVRLEHRGGAAFELGERSILGGTDILLERARTRTVTALTDTRLLKMRGEDWVELLEDSFEMTRRGVLSVAASLLRNHLSLPKTGGFVEPPPPSDEPLPALPLDFVDRLLVLTEAQILRRAGIQTLTSLVDVSDEHRVAKGELLFERGDARGRIYLVARGEVELTRSSPEIAARFAPGGFVGGPAALGSALEEWEARATVPTIALSFPEEDYFDVMEEHFDLARAALITMGEERDRLIDEAGMVPRITDPPGATDRSGSRIPPRSRMAD